MEDIEVINLLKSAFELKRQAKYKHAMELLYKALAICPKTVKYYLKLRTFTCY